MCESECALGHTLDTGRPVIDKSGYIITAQGRWILVSVSTSGSITISGVLYFTGVLLFKKGIL
ncbi:MAG: hypothetical protein ACOCSE_01810 [Chitinivibrionales bacterium]